ncbi:oxepin-CoA hydrolase, alternative type [Azohydromonas australica]|uniref:oxepin-CoA hydrolase, alternative type n=1 Tax=Azohydromonas australica TaxID=364039 RepID=UPI00040F9F96|nr:enoyl-CoA hydratase family protein [Azohydromonas australica]
MDNTLIRRREGPVLVLTHDNPGVRNALSPAFYAALAAALAEAQADAQIGAVVLTGAGGFFCAGGDLRQLARRRELAAEERRERLEGLHDLVRTIRGCGKPVVAAVEGGAAGAGVSLALACDLLVMARDAYFSVAYVKVGLTPDGGATFFLSELMPRQLLTELCLTGDRIGAERLAQFGAVNRLADPGRAVDEALALAQRLAAGPARATARIKDLCRRAAGATLDEQLEREARHMVDALGDAESAEGIAAFFDKRAADFRALHGAPEARTK